MKFLHIHPFYPQYLNIFYKEHPELINASFKEQIQAIMEDGLGGVHMFAPYLAELGYETQFIISNNPYSQQQWIKEHRLKINNPDNWMAELICYQIESFHPDIIYLNGFDSRLIKNLSQRPSLIMGWCGASIPSTTDWSEFDLILSGISGIREAAVKYFGAKSAEHFFPGFPSHVMQYVGDVFPQYDVVFSGQWTHNQHFQRNKYLKEIALLSRRTEDRITSAFYLSGHLNGLPPEIKNYKKPPQFGVSMYRALKTGRIAFDARANHEIILPDGQIMDFGKDETVNMRIFEATGSGAFLLTEYFDNLNQYFEPGKEIETFKDSKELIEKIHYYIAHPDEREAIARRGQARCLRDYSMEKRAGELDEIIKKHLNMKKEASTRNGYSPNLNIHSLLDSLNKNDNEKALLYADQIIETAPQWPGVHYGKAVALVRMGREVEAKQVLQQLLARLPDHAKGRQLLQELERARITNPLTDTDHVALEKELEVSFLVDIYKPFGIDVRKYFHGYDTVQIYKCLDTGFRFYYPFDISGDGEFYEKLESFDWYYMDWKWEHEIAASLIHSGNKVLEVGCARGSFLKQIQQNGIQCIGLELNSSAAKNARSKGIEVLEQGIEDHAREYPGKYAVVCAFEVLEHIAKVKDFLQSAIDLLKPGGRLILSVPNNDAFMFKVDEVQALNRPPHHMGLWNMNAFINLCNFFRLKLEGIELEPLQPYHLKYNHSLVRKRLVQEYGEKGKAMIDRNKELVAAVSQTIIKHIPGHTLLAHYTKI